jgi:hypothetical protein
MPVDGANCTAVTPARLLPAIERDTVLPRDPAAGFRDVIWGAGARMVKTSALEVPAGDETETLTCPAGTLAAMFTVAVTCVAEAFTLLTAMPVDGANCTAVTPARLLPAIERDTVLPGDPLAGLREVIWDPGAIIEKASELEIPAVGQTETETLTGPVGAPAAMVTVAVTCDAVAFTLLTVMPLDGENCTAVTPERLLPLITRETELPRGPLAGLRDAIWGAAGVVRGP